MSSETKADKIRKLLAENPTMKAGEIAKAINCNEAYVYLIKSQKKATKKTEVSEGQKVLRTHITNDGRLLAELEDEVQILRGKIAVLKNVIWYLQHGASI